MTLLQANCCQGPPTATIALPQVFLMMCTSCVWQGVGSGWRQGGLRATPMGTCQTRMGAWLIAEGWAR